MYHNNGIPQFEGYNFFQPEMRPNDPEYFREGRPEQPPLQGSITAENTFPYTYASEAGLPASGQWTDMPQNDRQLPRPPQPGDSLERRLRQIERQQQIFERDLNRLDRRQDRFNQELNGIERRVRVIERRLGIPVPPVTLPGVPPR